MMTTKPTRCAKCGFESTRKTARLFYSTFHDATICDDAANCNKRAARRAKQAAK